MRPLYSLFFLCLLLAAGRDLKAQDKQVRTPATGYESFHSIEMPVMNEDGNWIALRKRSCIPIQDKSDLDKDTVILFNLAAPGENKIVAYRPNVRELAFIGNNHLLLSGSEQTELLNLEKQTSIIYKGVKNIQVLKNKKQFVLHYSPEEKNRLELHDGNGELLNAADRVNRFYASEEDHIYAVTENEKTESEVILLTDSVKEKVYGSVRKILSLNIGPGKRGMMICEQSPKNNFREVLYLDLETKTTYPLKEVLPLAFQRCFFETVREGNLYFLKLWTNKEKQDTSAVDIWYGNDNRLEKKLYPPVDVRTYAWDPRTHFIRRVGTDHLPVSISTGNNRYFLSFDPIGLQDYSAENPPLQLYLYGLKENNYSLLDTIAPEFYLSGNGNYGLSPTRGGWNLYHFPSGTKKLIEGKELGSPWFTTDNQGVIFEGAGAVRHYEIKTATLTPLVTFKEYQTSIANGQWEGFATGKSAFAKQQVGLAEPMVIRLYNAEKNKTGYCLWYKGKTKVILPPTAKYIRSLNHNRSFTRFSWLEEDYNLPPRLVYKDLCKWGEKEKETVVYQSNKQDTAILSLKQEIIRYTNSDSIPLKGILYYPLGYDPSEKYPMVVHIYEKQNQQANLYPYPSYYESLGFNIRLFLEKGYFVFLPDIVIQGKAGPGLDALDCVNHALDAVAHHPLIDKSRIGLTGHSFGGYETDYIATRSSRFAAYVSGSGHSDIIWDANSFNYNFMAPDYVRVETNANMYKFGKPFSADKCLYFKNNPVYHAEKVSAPVLLWSGKEDQNVTADQTMAFYNALRRNGKDVIALFYKGERHDLQQPQSQTDLTQRILDWFDFFLKENTEYVWIERGLNRKNAY
jgi:dipeptidyl aminopeptidase/acylaminoacyl peptidase